MYASRLHSGTCGLVLAGGSGKRLASVIREYSGRTVPKQFCTFGRGRSLLRETVQRIASIAPLDRTAVVVDQTQLRRAAQQLRGTPELHLLSQPCDRGTGPGVLLPLRHLLEGDSATRVLITPSDHAIANQRLFVDGLRIAGLALDRGEADAVVFGVAPTTEDADYGWISPGHPIAEGLHEVHAFVEKPPAAESARLRRQGALWNTMVVLARGRALDDHYRRRLPSTACAFDRVMGVAKRERPGLLHQIYEQLAPSDFSRDILGTLPRLAVWRWPVAVGWCDLGTPDRLASWLEGSRSADRDLLAACHEAR